MTLPDQGYSVIEAEDGVAAVELAAEHRPDLVLLDWNMPGGSGEDALRALKYEQPELAVIVVTGEGGTSAEARASSLGADAFLPKPFSPLALLRSIEALLARRRPDQPAREETARDTASRSSSAE
jgi:DNA-binding response OmpR family regulator